MLVRGGGSRAAGGPGGSADGRGWVRGRPQASLFRDARGRGTEVASVTPFTLPPLGVRAASCIPRRVCVARGEGWCVCAGGLCSCPNRAFPEVRQAACLGREPPITGQGHGRAGFSSLRVPCGIELPESFDREVRAVFFGNTEEQAVDSAWEIGGKFPKENKRGLWGPSQL